MLNDFIHTDLFLLTLTVGLYCVGGYIYRRVHTPLLHPVLLTFIAVIVFLRGAGIDYDRYREATGILNFALGMSVVALGYLLYEQIDRLRGRLFPVGIATLAGCFVGVLRSTSPWPSAPSGRSSPRSPRNRLPYPSPCRLWVRWAATFR